MEEFKKELDLLLSKYPDIGEFTIHIQPRLKIIPIGNPTKVEIQIPTPNISTQNNISLTPHDIPIPPLLKELQKK